MLFISVRVYSEESHEVLLKRDTFTESENDTKTDDEVDLSAIENSEITNSLNGSDIASSTVVASDLSTSASLNETENNSSVGDDSTLATTPLDIGSNSTYDPTESTTVESHIGTTTPYLSTENIVKETVTENLNETAPDPANGTVPVDVTESVTNATQETANTEESTVSTIDMTVKETVRQEETVTDSTTTESLTTPINTQCPQIPDTDIDPKYRNETFDLYLEEFMKNNPSAEVYKSPGFPAPYAENLNCTLRFVNDLIRR